MRPDRPMLFVCAVGGLAATLVGQGPQRLALSVPAKSMKARADLVRNDVISQHLVPGKDYPLASIFHSASMIPTDRRVTPRLLARGGGVFRVTTDPATSSADLTNVAPTALAVPLNAVLQDRVFRIVLRLPARCVLKAKWDAAGTLTLSPEDPTNGILVTFLDVLTAQGIPLPVARSQKVDSLTVSGSLINLVTSGMGGAGISLTLDLTQ
jgi:hypothetical protein